MTERLTREQVQRLKDGSWPPVMKVWPAGFNALADTALSLYDENERLREALDEYAEHGSWRCAYRSRYDSCRCGLDETMESLGLEPVAVQDPEAQ